jgi:hypothetical protein
MSNPPSAKEPGAFYSTVATAAWDLLDQAHLVMTGASSPDNADVRSALANWSLVRQLQAGVFLIEAPSEWFFGHVDEVNAALKIVRARVAEIPKPEECARLLAETIAESAAAYAAEPAALELPDYFVEHLTGIVRDAREWPEGLWDDPLLMALTPVGYQALCGRSHDQWVQYVANTVGDPSLELSEQQRALARTLSHDWRGSGDSLVETVRGVDAV